MTHAVEALICIETFELIFNCGMCLRSCYSRLWRCSGINLGCQTLLLRL
jgi:hypothetical protein